MVTRALLLALAATRSLVVGLQRFEVRMASAAPKARVAIVGGGSFGSAMARVAARSVAEKADRFEPGIAWWVRRAAVVAEINEKRTNAQYFGGAIPDNVKATTDIAAAVRGADVVIVAVPGEFFDAVLPDVRRALAPGAAVVSLCKSMALDGVRETPRNVDVFGL